MSHALYPIVENTMPINHNLAQEYFNTLPQGDINRKYYEGLQFRTTKGCMSSYIFNRFTTYSKLDTLTKFYPYQKAITETRTQINEDWKENMENALIFTAASWFFLYQYAKRGRVLPILKEYGMAFKTHRLFRHYAYTLVVPLLYANESIFNQYHDHIEVLWSVHVNRLNNKLLSDPFGTKYPDSLRGPARNVQVNYYH